MSLQRAVTISEAIAIDADETADTFSSVLAFDNYNAASRMEAKINITAGEADAELTATFQVSDDGVTRFDVPTITTTVTGLTKWMITSQVIGNKVRVKYAFAKGAAETIPTAGTISLLVR